MMKASFTVRSLPLAALLAAGLLAGCSDQARQASCPGTAALADASTQYVFREGTSPDPANVLYRLQIVDVKAHCDLDKKARTVATSLDIRFRATRAPTGETGQYNAPYFIAVTQADRIINKQAFQIQFSFAPGEATADFTDSVPSTVIQADKEKHSYDYAILVGLPLTKEQLDYNRTIGRFTQ
jgi:hypothetical protein